MIMALMMVMVMLLIIMTIIRMMINDDGHDYDSHADDDY